MLKKDFVELFSWKLVEGHKDAILTDNNSVLISTELGEKIFPDATTFVGKEIHWEQEGFTGVYQVSGVFEGPTKHSSLQFDLVFNYDLFFKQNVKNLSNWGNSNPSTYLVLREGANTEQFSEKLSGFIKQKVEAAGDSSLLAFVGDLILQPYSERYLESKFENGKQVGGRIVYVKLFGLIAIFLLAIAGINFMNLSTARAAIRAKEIAVKKAIGAGRKSFIAQFLGEALLLSFMALLIAIVLVVVLLPQFNLITGKSLQLTLRGELLWGALLITFLTGIFSGSYPAFYLSALQPLRVLKGKLQTSVAELSVRRSLVVFQFVVSVFSDCICAGSLSSN